MHRNLNNLFPTPLPTELTLFILSYLPLSTLASLQLTNTSWKEFLTDNEGAVYRAAAVREGLVGEGFHAGMVLGDLGGLGGSRSGGVIYSERAMRGVDGWKSFCKKRKTIARAWTARAPSRILSSPRHLEPELQVPRPHVTSPLTTVIQTWGYPPPPGALLLASQAQAQAQAQAQVLAHAHEHANADADANGKREASMHYRRVHRVKVDEKAGITMATTQLGGLVVRDLETDAVLWELPVWYVRAYAHLEYGEGYMIFDRDDGNKEVWRRTAEVSRPSASQTADRDQDHGPELPFDPASAPDERQRHVVNYISLLSPASPSPSPSHPSSSSSSSTHPHPAPSSLPTPSPTNPNPTDINPTKASFTPYAVLHMPETTRAYRGLLHMPETTRAYRFVYPDLLVAGLERAYVFDVRSGRVVLCVDGIQVVEPLGQGLGQGGGQGQGQGGEEEHESAEQEEREEEEGDDMEVFDEAQGVSEWEEAEGMDTSSSSSGGDTDVDSAPVPVPINPYQPAQPTPNVHLPQFLGLVRYVDISARHLFFAGRYLLRVFSRETGRCVLDVPSSRWRYGRWRWEVASRVWGEGRAQEGRGEGVDSHAKAKGKGKEGGRERGWDGPREAVRVPVRFSEEDYARSLAGRTIVDQFVAVHVSNDGKHLVALLSGSRLVMIPHFEAFLTPGGRVGPSPGLVPPPPPPPPPPTGAAAAAPTTTTSSSSGVPQPAKRKRKGKEKEKEKEKEKQKETQSQQRKDAELFAHTWDIQLGAPSASGGVYLAFENGRVGVVTTNAVYVVTPSIPAEPPLLPRTSTRSLRKAKLKRLDHPAAATTSASHDDSDANHKFNQDHPSLQVTRLPYFSNPSWLNEVSSLMMSDTGLYLNWNPTWPEPRGILEEDGQEKDKDKDGEVDREEMEMEMETGEENESENGFGEEYASEKERVLEEWDREYEDDLEAYERLEGDRYHPQDEDRPFLQITRLPYFTNPSWLNEVSCLMMSDTGLYLNWNPTWPEPRGILGDEGGGKGGEDGVKEENENENGLEEEYVSEKERVLEEWDREYEDDLEAYERLEGDRYHLFQNGDMFVAPAPRDLEESELSTIYSVDFSYTPPPPKPAHVHAQVRELVMQQEGAEADAGGGVGGEGGGVYETMEVVDEAEPEGEREVQRGACVEGRGESVGEEDEDLISL
ncbi:hypothetical protein GALMADRAFT_255298 [Galerina marginata CBS 339.88]|uniref:F-box domain-containing protein n=1 Tax=Galerina marginata (strain CBS 339.88) TaxID=685588 RepID=A0A067SJ14_GALM3|nr:hypothetical protein GALMADRAFT_255298 [Galerina marginata CBS 339.88]